VYFAAALPVAACDCMALEPMPAYAGQPQWVIFTGTVQMPEPDGVPVLVSRWFQGPDPAGLVRIQGTWGVGGASCETPLPPAGSEWIFLASRRDTGELDVNLCTPHAALGSDAGAAMLADAIATFGGGGGGGGGSDPNTGVGGPEPTAEPAGPAAAPTSPGSGNAGADVTPFILGATVTAAAGLLAGVALVARTRRRDESA
jgi:hypothetical protein